MSSNEQAKYKAWPATRPAPEDAPLIRRLWSQLRRNRFAYMQRRILAHDYAVAKCSGKKEQEVIG